MTTYNTGNPLGSSAAKDLYDNTQNFDHLSNDQSNELWPDRFGNPRLTWHGMEIRYQEKLASMGWTLIDSFQDGANLTREDEALRWKRPDGDGEYYRWDGAFPKVVPAGSTPDSTGGQGVGAWVSVGDASLRSQLASEYGASLVNTQSGKSVQDYVNEQENFITEQTITILVSFDDAIKTNIKSNVAMIKFKYGSIEYEKTGNTGYASSGDAYIFYDASGKEFRIIKNGRNVNINSHHCFTEIWAKENIDPTYFNKITSLGVGTLIVYTWLGNSFQYHEHFLDLCELYGIDVILQAVPDQQYTDNLDADFAHLSALFDHPTVKGLYLLDEPDLSEFPLSRQGEIISKARSLSNLPLYAATNAEANNENVPLHKDFDFIYTSNYSHYNDVNGIIFYEITTWSSLEEEGLRKGRVIPLLTSYWYEGESPILNTSQMKEVNDYLSMTYKKIGLWMFWGAKQENPGYHYLENDDQILNLTVSSIANNSVSLGASKRLIRSLLGTAQLPDNSYKYLSKATGPFDIPLLDASSVASWNTGNASLRFRTGETINFSFGTQARIRGVYLSFIDNNGPSDTAVIKLIFNPTIGGGGAYTVTKSATGGGSVLWTFPENSQPPHNISSLGLKVESMSTSSNPPDYLILTSVGFAYEQ